MQTGDTGLHGQEGGKILRMVRKFRDIAHSIQYGRGGPKGGKRLLFEIIAGEVARGEIRIFCNLGQGKGEERVVDMKYLFIRGHHMKTTGNQKKNFARHQFGGRTKETIRKVGTDEYSLGKN